VNGADLYPYPLIAKYLKAYQCSLELKYIGSNPCRYTFFFFNFARAVFTTTNLNSEDNPSIISLYVSKVICAALVRLENVSDADICIWFCF
jgi:hypothetical protein